jgi:hypothetical protein
MKDPHHIPAALDLLRADLQRTLYIRQSQYHLLIGVATIAITTIFTLLRT